MKSVNMKQFAEASGYPYEFVRKLAKQHGSWKSLVEHVKLKKTINPIIGIGGFITHAECFEFYKNNQSMVKSIVYQDRYSTFNNNWDDRVVLLKSLAADGHSTLCRDSCESLLRQANTRYSAWYTRPVWLILKDFGYKLNKLIEG